MHCFAKKSIQFIVLTCLVSWAAAGAAILLGMREAAGLAYTAFAMAYMLLPAICSVILQKIHKEKPLRFYGAGNKPAVSKCLIFI